MLSFHMLRLGHAALSILALSAMASCVHERKAPLSDDLRVVTLPSRDGHPQPKNPALLEWKEISHVSLDAAGRGFVVADGRLYSTVNGRVFKDRTPAELACAHVGTCELLFGTSGKTVWLAPDNEDGKPLVLQFSRDDGATWERRVVPGVSIPIGLTFVDRAPILTIVARPSATLDPSVGTSTLRSLDDGKEWKTVAKARERGAIVEAPERLFFASSMQTKDARVVTKLLVASLQKPEWKAVKLAKDDIVSFVPRFSADGKNGVLCTDSAREIRVSRTSDGGDTWSVVKTDAEAGACDELMPTARGACFALRGSTTGSTFLCTRDWGATFEKFAAYEGAEVLAFTDGEDLAAWGFVKGEIVRQKQSGALEHWFPLSRDP